MAEIVFCDGLRDRTLVPEHSVKLRCANEDPEPTPPLQNFNFTVPQM